MGKFRDIDLDSIAELVRLGQLCRDFYAILEDGEEPEEADVEDMCIGLQDRDFYDLVKPYFPFLRRETDEYVDPSHPTVVYMLQAADDHLPVPYLPPQSEKFEVTYARVIYSVCIHPYPTSDSASASPWPGNSSMNISSSNAMCCKQRCPKEASGRTPLSEGMPWLPSSYSSG
jgi:hypothetical protein